MSHVFYLLLSLAGDPRQLDGAGDPRQLDDAGDPRQLDGAGDPRQADGAGDPRQADGPGTDSEVADVICGRVTTFPYHHAPWNHHHDRWII
jgi:hypothetical protein